MASHHSKTKELRTLGAILRVPFEALIDYNYRRLAEAGFDDVRPAHGAVLRHIARDGSRVTDLAQRAHMTKQSMAELVAWLQQRGYAEMTPDPQDGRAKLVRLTDRGWQVHATLVNASKAFEKEYAQSVGAAEWKRLRSLLERFAAWADERAQVK